MRHYFIFIAMTMFATACHNKQVKEIAGKTSTVEQDSVVVQDTLYETISVEPSVPYYSATEEKCKNEIDLQEYQFKYSEVVHQIAKRTLHSSAFEEYEYRQNCRMMLKVYKDTTAFVTPLDGLEVPDSSIGFCEIEHRVFFLVGHIETLLQPYGNKKRFGVKKPLPHPFDPPTWRFKVRQQ